MRHARYLFKMPGHAAASKRLFGRGRFPDGTAAIIRFDAVREAFRAVPLGGKRVDEKGDGTAIITWSFAEVPDDNRLLEIVNNELRKHGNPEISKDQLDEVVTTNWVTIEKPTMYFQQTVDLVALRLSGLKIAYEFTVDTLGEFYLMDATASVCRDLILAGIPVASDAGRTCIPCPGYLGPIEHPSGFPGAAGLPDSANAIILKREGRNLFVAIRLFNVYEGGYTMSTCAETYLQDGEGRRYVFDPVSGLSVDQRFAGQA